MKGPTIYDDVEFTPRCVDPNDNDVGSIVVVIWILVMVSFFERCGQFNPFLLIIFQHNSNLYFVLNSQKLKNLQCLVVYHVPLGLSNGISGKYIN